MRLALTTVAAFLILGQVGSLQAETRTVPESRSQVQLSFAPVVKHVAPVVVNVYGARVDKRRRSANADEFFRRFFGDGTRTSSLIMQNDPHQIRFIDSIHVTDPDVKIRF